MKKIEDLLFSYQDLKYRDFEAKLSPTLPKDVFIGIRSPVLRNLVKEISEEDANEFLKELPHKYYEENLLHGFIIQKRKNYEEALNLMKEFLPYIDCWAVCDTCRPKCFEKHKDELYPEIIKWINSKETYTIRFGIDMLMSMYLDKEFKEEHYELVKKITSKEYYVQMMQAWYFATALAKQWDSAVKVIESKELDKWIHNKSIQKAIESFRVSDEHKEYLKTLRIK